MLMVALMVLFAGACKPKSGSQLVSLKVVPDTLQWWDSLTKSWDYCSPMPPCPYVEYQEFTVPMGQQLQNGGPFGYPHIAITNFCNLSEDFYWVLAEKSTYADISELDLIPQTTIGIWFPSGTPKIYNPSRHPTAWVRYRVAVRRWQSGNPCGYYHYYNIKLIIDSGLQQ